MSLTDYYPDSDWSSDPVQERDGEAAAANTPAARSSRAMQRPGLAADGAWPGGKGKKSVIVALIDSGVDADLPELSGNLWTNPDEIAANGVDDDHNGYVDDSHGWNFVADNADISDDNGHGTFNAGIIAAHDAGGFIRGVNPQARLMVLKVLDQRLKGDSARLGFAVIYAVQNGARVINLSVGGDSFSRFERDAIDYARQKGVLVVVAAGNEGASTTSGFPGGLDGVITVSATDQNNRHSSFSNWGPGIDIAAQGVEVLSLRARDTDLLRLTGPKDYVPGSAIMGPDQRYYRATGTSFAAPMVSGAASLILSVHPGLTAIEVTRMLLNSADDIGIPGRDQFFGHGLLNIKKALVADPHFDALVRIEAIKQSRENDRNTVRVSGTVTSTDFKSARLELGDGQQPRTWTPVGTVITHPLQEEPLGTIPAADFPHAGRWTVRLLLSTEHHGTHEARAILNIK